FQAGELQNQRSGNRRSLKVYFASAAFTATRRSATKRLYSRSRDASSGWRRSEEGWTVATTFPARGDDKTLPRSFMTRKRGPKMVCPAVEPRTTTSFGSTRRNSASNHGRQAA